MAKIPPPGKTTKGLPPTVQDTVKNLSRAEAGQLKPLNFKVPPEFHREFKTFAACHGLSMVDVLREGFELMKERLGG
jgi:hypothetical protein